MSARSPALPGSTMPDLAVGQTLTVRAPATSANLGPGFDSLALCLDLADVVTAEVTTGGTDVEITGEGASVLPTDDTHLVVATMRSVFEQWGLAQPGLRLRCSNAVPQGRGLGSSAAAICAGVRLAAGLSSRSLTQAQLLALATAVEGHPDNVAACLLGGLTIAWTETDGPHAVSIAVTAELAPVLFISPTGLPTSVARSVLPATVPHRQASENSARTALLVASLTTHPDLLWPATVDALHQEARRPALTESMAVLDELRAVGIAAVLSGAGPSVLALCVRSQVERALAHAPAAWRALPLEVDTHGVQASAWSSPDRSWC